SRHDQRLAALRAMDSAAGKLVRRLELASAGTRDRDRHSGTTWGCTLNSLGSHSPVPTKCNGLPDEQVDPDEDEDKYTRRTSNTQSCSHTIVGGPGSRLRLHYVFSGRARSS